MFKHKIDKVARIYRGCKVINTKVDVEEHG